MQTNWNWNTLSQNYSNPAIFQKWLFMQTSNLVEIDRFGWVLSKIYSNPTFKTHFWVDLRDFKYWEVQCHDKAWPIPCGQTLHFRACFHYQINRNLIIRIKKYNYYKTVRGAPTSPHQSRGHNRMPRKLLSCYGKPLEQFQCQFLLHRAHRQNRTKLVREWNASHRSMPRRRRASERARKQSFSLITPHKKGTIIRLSLWGFKIHQVQVRSSQLMRAWSSRRGATMTYRPTHANNATAIKLWLGRQTVLAFAEQARWMLLRDQDTSVDGSHPPFKGSHVAKRVL